MEYGFDCQFNGATVFIWVYDNDDADDDGNDGGGWRTQYEWMDVCMYNILYMHHIRFSSSFLDYSCMTQATRQSQQADIIRTLYRYLC